MQSIGSKLTTYLSQVQDKPFDWASNNCSHFVYGWYAYLGGQASYPVHAPTQREAIRRSLGDPYAFIAYVEQCLDMPSMCGAYASVGDVVLVRVPAFDIVALGICNGDLTACLSNNGKVVFEDLGRVATWKISNA